MSTGQLQRFPCGWFPHITLRQQTFKPLIWTWVAFCLVLPSLHLPGRVFLVPPVGGYKSSSACCYCSILASPSMVFRPYIFSSSSSSVILANHVISSQEVFSQEQEAHIPIGANIGMLSTACWLVWWLEFLQCQNEYLQSQTIQFGSNAHFKWENTKGSPRTCW